MRKKHGAAVLGLLIVMLVSASPAEAATEAGSNCAANTGTGGPATAVQLAKVTGDPIPIAAPASGVVTRWKVNSTISGEFSQQLKVLRPAGNPKSFLTVGESSPGTVVKGQNSFPTQIRVQAGDRFGVAANSGAAILFCSTGNPGDEMGLFSANVAVNSTNEFPPIPGLIAAVAVVIEPDADNDGFGDETQDKCPRSAAIQAIECPPITLGSYGVASKGSALILASASSQSTVNVSGTVKLPKSGKKGKAKTVSLFTGAKPVGPGQVVPFTLAFSQSVKKALAALPAKKSLTLNVTASTTDLAGALSTSVVSLKLKGQAKKAKAKPKKG